jgi:hypothetical protein
MSSSLDRSLSIHLSDKGHDSEFQGFELEKPNVCYSD